MATSLSGATVGELDDRLLVHELIEPRLIVDAADAIESAFVASCPLPPLSARVSISAQGCLRFVDIGAQAAPSGVLPRTDRAAATIARDFLQRATDAVNRATQGRVRDLFQRAALQHGTTRRYGSPQSRAPQTWVSTWQLNLASHAFGRHALAPVLGGTVSVRIGGDGRVVGLVSAVRPVVGRVARPALAYARQAHGGAEAARGPAPAATPAPTVVYVAEGPECPQRFLAPCYVDPAALDPEHQTTHGHAKLWPACDHTLIVQISVFQREDGASLRAMRALAGGELGVLDGRPPYRVLWGVATQAEFIDGNFRIEGGAALELDRPGLYHVELTVEDTDNGSVATSFVYVPVLGKSELPAPRDRGASPSVA